MAMEFTKEKGPYWLEIHAEGVMDEFTRCLKSALNTPGKEKRGGGIDDTIVGGKALFLREWSDGPVALTGHFILSTHICLKMSIIQGFGVFVFSQKQINQRGKELSQILLYISFGYFLLSHNCLHPSTLKIIRNA